jgi:hypothetical protein
MVLSKHRSEHPITSPVSQIRYQEDIRKITDPEALLRLDMNTSDVSLALAAIPTKRVLMRALHMHAYI